MVRIGNTAKMADVQLRSISRVKFDKLFAAEFDGGDVGTRGDDWSEI